MFLGRCLELKNTKSKRRKVKILDKTKIKIDKDQYLYKINPNLNILYNLMSLCLILSLVVACFW